MVYAKIVAQLKLLTNLIVFITVFDILDTMQCEKGEKCSS
jgi:hypothetical protein